MILGHKIASMTKRYSHLSPGHLQGAVAVIDVQSIRQAIYWHSLVTQ
jgi:hypothetical protein